MQFVYTPELAAYMKASGKSNIIVEAVVSSSSDFEVSELHIHFVSEAQAELFIRRQKFRRIETECGSVLLPNYRLDYDPVITFSLKKVLFLHLVKCDGIRL